MFSEGSTQPVFLFFTQSNHFLFCRARHTTAGVPSNDAIGEQKVMKNVSSVGSKKISGDTRNNWMTMLFVTKKRYRCFRKQSHIDTCTEAFKDLEHLGFEFGKFGFAVTHVHFQVNIPKKYYIENAEIILKSETSKRMFERHPGFRKRYPKCAFWSGYEHHESTGLIDLEKSIAYCRSQQRHHGVTVVDDRRAGIRQCPKGVPRKRRQNGIIRAEPLFHKKDINITKRIFHHKKSIMYHTLLAIYLAFLKIFTSPTV